MKITEYPEEIKAFTEFACMVCMFAMRMSNPQFEGCSNRPHDEYCPWMENVIQIAMHSKEKEKQDIFSKWAEIPIVKETFKKQAEIVPKDKPIYTNYRGLK